MGSVTKIFKKSPEIFKKTYYSIIPFHYRYGYRFNKMLNTIESSKKWSYDQTKNYQLENIKKVLIFCDKNIPYYNNLFKKNGFDINIKHFDDLKNLPFLTKKIINENFDSLINKKFTGKHYKMYTSGTTGERLTLLGTDDLFKIECAFITNAFNDHGSRLYKDHSIWIRRYSPSQKDPIFFDDFELNRSYMSAFDLNDKTVFNYIKYINEKKSKTLVSYPSTIYWLSCLCEKHNLELKYVKHLHGASEVCLPKWREKIKNIFNINIKMHYGQVEKISFAHQDNNDDLYKENLIYSYNEILEDNTICGTGFYNELMPLIRYKTNDKIIKNDNFDKTSFPKSILDIEGRNGDMLLKNDNSYVPAVNFYSFISKIKEIDLFQIIQEKNTKNLKIKIICNNQYNQLVEKYLENELKNRLGNINIVIEKVNYIERDEKSNKFKTISLI